MESSIRSLSIYNLKTFPFFILIAVVFVLVLVFNNKIL